MSNNELSETQLDHVAGGAPKEDKVVLECEKIGTTEDGRNIFVCTEKKPAKKAPKPSPGGAPILE